jgi:glycosyltransferase involved in cell wall biosynthesis
VSIGYAVGGHTGMLRRWIENDDSGDEHHLALTFMDKLALPELGAAVERSGGKVTLLGGVPTLLDKARQLRDLAWRDADRVVVHCHMWDIVPTIAFGVAGGPPVLFLNHADHAFWVGASIADLVVNLRRSGEELAIRHRGVDRNFLFRIPLADPGDPLRATQERAAIRARLGIPRSAIVFLTVGAPFKYKAVDDLDFQATVQRLLAALPEAYLVAVGPSAGDADWKAAVQASRPRLILLGEQRPVSGYHAAADIYVEGFPFDSHTALLEAAVSGLPVVRIPANAVPPFSGHHFPLSVVTQPADVESYVARAIALANSPEMRRATARALHDAVVGLQCGTAWRQLLSELKAAAPDRHAIHELHPVDVDRELDRFWTAFLMRVHSGKLPQFVFRLATELRLETGSALHPMLAEYRRWLGRQSMGARAQIFIVEKKLDVQLERLLFLYSRLKTLCRSGLRARRQR